MAKTKKVKEAKISKPKVKTPAVKFRYACPACTKVAIKTSNKMLGVSINCGSCGKLIKLDDEKRYQKI